MKITRQTITIKNFKESQQILFDCMRHPEKYASEVTLKMIE
jgi:hypothetical protein